MQGGVRAMEVIVVEEEREAGGAVEAGVVMHCTVFRDSPRGGWRGRF